MSEQKIDLEQQRLKSEIEFFKTVTESIKEAKKPDENSSTGNGFSLAFFATLLTIIAGGIGTYIQVSDYLEQRRKAYSVTYSNEMISFIDKLQSKDVWVRDHSIFLLSSYEMDAVPILLLSLESNPGAAKEIYLRSLKMIKDKKNVDAKEFVKVIIKSSEQNILRKHLQTFDDQEDQDNKIDAIRNYIYLLAELGLDQKKLVNQHFEFIENKVNEEVQNGKLTQIEERKLRNELKDRLAILNK